MNRVQQLELVSILLNPLFFVIGVLWLNWTLYETLVLFWVEPLIALLLRFYVQIITPALHGTGQSQIANSNNDGTFVKFLFFAIYILMMQGIGLWATITVLQPNQNIWLRTDLWTLLLLFILVLLMPVWLLERQGIRPQMRYLPVQSKILVHPVQAVSTYLILAATLGSFYAWASIWISILVLAISKLAVEISLFYKLKI